MSRILVWDLPVRLGHWLMAGSFAAAWLTAESEAWRDVHVIAGYLFAALVAFRLVWGVIGTRHARFADFVRLPGAALSYLKAMLQGRPQHCVGHNPAGGYAILALLVLGAATAASGVANYLEIGGELFEEAHEAFASAMLLVVLLHLAGVAAGSLAHGENLPLAMLTGYKRGDPALAIGGQGWLAAALMLGWLWLAVRWLAASFG
jgi:cytochrome b